MTDNRLCFLQGQSSKSRNIQVSVELNIRIKFFRVTRLRSLISTAIPEKNIFYILGVE
jgi:hypothetical protein